MREHAEAPKSLATRYGRQPSHSDRKRRTVIIISAVAMALFVVWLIWSGIGGSTTPLQATDTAHNIEDSHHVSVTFTIETDPGRTAACAVQAMNDDFAVVGWKIVEVPASNRRARSFTEIVRTTELSNTGLIKYCWLT